MPNKDTAHPEKFQAMLSSFTINSFLHSVTEVMDLEFWLRDDVTCSQLNTLLPGIAEYYGADQKVDIYVKINSIDNFEVTAKN